MVGGLPPGLIWTATISELNLTVGFLLLVIWCGKLILAKFISPRFLFNIKWSCLSFMSFGGHSVENSSSEFFEMMRNIPSENCVKFGIPMFGVCQIFRMAMGMINQNGYFNESTGPEGQIFHSNIRRHMLRLTTAIKMTQDHKPTV